MINNDCHHKYLLRFLQKNKYDSQISSVASENYYNDTHCNSSLLRDDMIVVLIASVIMQKSTAASREEMILQRLIK